MKARTSTESILLLLDEKDENGMPTLKAGTTLAEQLGLPSRYVLKKLRELEKAGIVIEKGQARRPTGTSYEPLWARMPVMTPGTLFSALNQLILARHCFRLTFPYGCKTMSTDSKPLRRDLDED